MDDKEKLRDALTYHLNSLLFQADKIPPEIQQKEGIYACVTLEASGRKCFHRTGIYKDNGYVSPEEVEAVLNDRDGKIFARYYSKFNTRDFIVDTNLSYGTATGIVSGYFADGNIVRLDTAEILKYWDEKIRKYGQEPDEELEK